MNEGIWRLAALGGLLALGGCKTTVKTFDGQGNVLGECEVTRLIPGGQGLCTGSANPKDQK